MRAAPSVPLTLLCFFALAGTIVAHKLGLRMDYDIIAPPPSECPQHIGPPCPRFYVNDLQDYKPGANTSISQDLAYNISSMSLKYIDIILKNAGPQAKDTYTVADGTAGRALLFLRLLKNDAPHRTDYLTIAKGYIDNALQHMVVNPAGDVGFLDSYVGVLAVAAVIYDKLGDKAHATQYIGQVQTAFDTTTSTDSTFDTGKAGLLMAGYFLDNYFGAGTITQSSKLKIAYEIIEDGVKGGSNGHMSWKNSVYPNIIFWGQGHGSTGIVQQLMELPELLQNTTVVTLLKTTLDYFVSLQFPDGNFPTPQVPPYPDEPDVLVQWCHGSPGFMPVLTKGWQLFGDQKYLASAQKAADNAWINGLLTKGLMLCHGISGNTYMFLYMNKLTGDPKYLYRAIKFQEYVLSHPIVSDPAIMRIPDPNPYMFFVASYTGALVLWSDMLASLNQSITYHMPGFAAFI